MLNSLLHCPGNSLSVGNNHPQGFGIVTEKLFCVGRVNVSKMANARGNGLDAPALDLKTMKNKLSSIYTATNTNVVSSASPDEAPRTTTVSLLLSPSKGKLVPDKNVVAF